MNTIRRLILPNIIFPVFMFYFSPPLLGLAAAASLIIDAAVMFVILLFFHIKIKNRLGLLMALWGIGMAADIFAALLLMLSGKNGSLLSLNLIDFYYIYTSPLSVALFCLAILISAVLTYRLDLVLLKKRMSTKQAKRMALLFAVFTAPYAFLIPTSWLV
ncbi:hypothetical protein [Sporolactobacillus sp. KGMB 08714]|uniref:hypothetical protein n=1 Tax=Sporolactobacillus sp. KGMB 08714 TaxID=3064704 RepID=UPI002FBE6FE4